MSLRLTVPLCALVALAASADPARADDPPPPLVEKYLTEGKLAEGEKDLTAHLAKHPDDAQARYGLGVLQFFRAVEHLYQGLYRYGLGSKLDNLFLFGNIPFLRLPIEKNPNPEPVSAAKLDKVFRAFLDDLTKSRKTLEGVTDARVKLPLHLFAVRLDLNGDGKATADEGLARIVVRMFGPQQVPPTVAHGGTLICFDAADVHWLRGYCHLLSALTEVILAYDWTEVVEGCGHLFFARVEGPHPFLTEGRKVFNWEGTDIADVIALFHLLRMPLRDKAGMTRALEHFEAVIARSRVTWELILAETDDDNEWIPNLSQRSALTGVRVTREMIEGWFLFLDEAEALLKGKKLVPFWRGSADVGVNLRRVFTEPRALDLVLWVQGTAATPYLEKGEFTRQATWDRLQRTFRGDFIGFAIWFN
jgi:hypothetical protein